MLEFPMSVQLIQQFHRKLEQLVQYGGSRNETSIRGARQDKVDLIKGMNPKWLDLYETIL